MADDRTFERRSVCCRSCLVQTCPGRASSMCTWLVVALLADILAVSAEPSYVVLQQVPASCTTSATSALTCYSMYGRVDGSGVTWQEAFDCCLRDGRQMAAVSSHSEQSLLRAFRSSEHTGNGHGWIAARRDNDAVTWHDVTGQPFNEVKNTNDYYKCAALVPDESRDYGGLVVPRKCYSSAKRALCQHRDSPDVGYRLGGYGFTLSPEHYSSWFLARDYCLSQRADLAFTSITNGRLIQHLGLTSEVWVGVVRQPWMWYYGDGVRVPVSYTSWRDYEGDGSNENCAHVELNDDLRWSDKSCQATSKVFICEDVQPAGVATEDNRFVVTRKSTFSTSVTSKASGYQTAVQQTNSSTTATTGTTTTLTEPATTSAVTTFSSGGTTSRTVRANRPDVTSFSYDDVFNGVYWPSGYYGYFSGKGDDLIYRDDKGDLYIENVATGIKEFIMSYDILSSLDSWTYYVSPDYRYVLIAYDRIQLYRYSFNARYKIYDRQIRSLIDFPMREGILGERLQVARWAEGNKLSFVYENDLYYQSTPYVKAVRVTSDGAKHVIINGVPDWMYEEDVLWSNNAHYWSPSGRYLCYAKFNLTGIPLMKIPVYGSVDQMNPDIMEFVYPKAGDIRDGQAGPTTKVELYVLDTARPSKSHLRVLPPRELIETDHYVTLVSWRDDVTVYVEWTNRAMNKSFGALCAIDSVILRCVRGHEVVVKDGWVDIPSPDPLFINNAQHYLTILPQYVEGHGTWQHLALVKVQNSGTTIPVLSLPLSVRFLTNGTHEVANIVGFDKTKQTAYFTSTGGDPTERHLFSVGTTSHGPDITCLTCNMDPTCLYADASFSSTGKYYILSCRGPGIPKYYLKSTEHDAVRVLESNEYVASFLAKKRLPTRSFVDIKINDRFSSKAEIWFPPNFNASKKYHHLHYVYAAPDSQQVSKNYILGTFRSNWFLYLSSSHDVIITKMDGRGSYGYGNDMRHAAYKKLGVVDVADQITAVRYFRSLPYINSDVKSAVAGWSFGGKVSALSLVDDSDVFECGLVISADSNTRYYNRAYSERYLGFANESVQAYDNTDVMRRAVQFVGKKLFIAHGTKDDNVHFMHYAHLVRALTEAGVQFTSFMYTDENHNLAQYDTTRHLFRAMTDFIISDCWGKP